MVSADNKAHSQIKSVGAQHAVPAVTAACSIRRHIPTTRNRDISAASWPSTNAGHSMLCPYSKRSAECGMRESVIVKCRNVENSPAMLRRYMAVSEISLAQIPAYWIQSNVFAGLFEVVLVADYVFVVSTLPNLKQRLPQHGASLLRHCRFEGSHNYRNRTGDPGPKTAASRGAA